MAEGTTDKAKAEPSSASKKGMGRQFAAYGSAVIWTASFFLSFVIPPGSPLIWVPDTLLLLGFVPLLFIWKPAWPWLVFGFCNIGIGFVLAVTPFLDDSLLPGELPKVRQHLAEFHVPLVWILLGAASVLYGLVRLVRGLISWLHARTRKKSG